LYENPAILATLAIASALFPSSLSAVFTGTVGLPVTPATPEVRRLPARAAAIARARMLGPKPVLAVFEQATPITVPLPNAKQEFLTWTRQTMKMTTGH
jgi:hypothetical protein